MTETDHSQSVVLKALSDYAKYHEENYPLVLPSAQCIVQFSIPRGLKGIHSKLGLECSEGHKKEDLKSHKVSNELNKVYSNSNICSCSSEHDLKAGKCFDGYPCLFKTFQTMLSKGEAGRRKSSEELSDLKSETSSDKSLNTSFPLVFSGSETSELLCASLVLSGQETSFESEKEDFCQTSTQSSSSLTLTQDSNSKEFLCSPLNKSCAEEFPIHDVKEMERLMDYMESKYRKTFSEQSQKYNPHCTYFVKTLWPLTEARRFQNDKTDSNENAPKLVFETSTGKPNEDVHFPEHKTEHSQTFSEAASFHAEIESKENAPSFDRAVGSRSIKQKHIEQKEQTLLSTKENTNVMQPGLQNYTINGNFLNIEQVRPKNNGLYINPGYQKANLKDPQFQNNWPRTMSYHTSGIFQKTTEILQNKRVVHPSNAGISASTTTNQPSTYKITHGLYSQKFGASNAGLKVRNERVFNSDGKSISNPLPFSTSSFSVKPLSRSCSVTDVPRSGQKGGHELQVPMRYQYNKNRFLYNSWPKYSPSQRPYKANWTHGVKSFPSNSYVKDLPPGFLALPFSKIESMRRA